MAWVEAEASGSLSWVAGSPGRRRRAGLIAIAAVTLCSLSACAWVAGVPRSPWGEWLLPPASLGESVRAVQQWRLAAGAETRVLQGVLEVDPQGLTLVGLSGFGQRVITLRHDGATLHEERQPRLSEAWEGRRLLRSLQLVYWPRDALRAALPPGWEIAEAGETRLLTHVDGAAVRIRCQGGDRWQGRCEYEDLRSDYHLMIDSQIEAP